MYEATVLENLDVMRDPGANWCVCDEGSSSPFDLASPSNRFSISTRYILQYILDPGNNCFQTTANYVVKDQRPQPLLYKGCIEMDQSIFMSDCTFWESLVAGRLIRASGDDRQVDTIGVRRLPTFSSFY